MGSTGRKYYLDEEQLNELCRTAARVGVESYRKELKKNEKAVRKHEDKGYRTKKILMAYRRMKANLEDDAEFTEDEKIELRWKFIMDLMDPGQEAGKPNETVKDMERRHQEDLYCVHRIERAVELYQLECENSGSEESKRRFRELSMMYLEEKQYTVKEIAEIENLDEKTVYKDLGIARSIMSVYLLGM